MGLIRTFYGDPDVASDFTPVDMVIKAMIIAAWKRAMDTTNESPVSEVPVYNCSTSKQLRFTSGFLNDTGAKLTKNIPFSRMIWKPCYNVFTKSKCKNFARVSDDYQIKCKIIKRIQNHSKQTMSSLRKTWKCLL